ncbi:heptaprenyl diphosphate synthase [Anoxybacter fermentans]|uniref:Heptaprenyl diphosphate synthase n=1 Tax=Anoxybacter fermentans TaxID=1323375 RepID=A0A3S9SWE6_9FIRM|nr:Gx transporter family protein [Anoxybacter fermentans]AZR72604.1 heptaprenyl diphosphate synthase [Anoxybacter fermentans]
MSRYTQITYIGILVALALVLQLVEGMLPLPYIAPGVKLGLANIVSLIAIIYFGFKTAFLVVLFRTFMAAFLSGRPYVFLYSGTGAILSILVMGFVYWRFRKYFSIQGISIFGAVAHNIGQIFIASLLIETVSIFSYLPILMVSGVITGYFIGLIVNLLKRVLDPTLKGKF